MLYTRRGDDGTSGLFGTKERFGKESPVYEALGTLDELNSLLGLCRAHALDTHDGIDTGRALLTMQECLFIAQAELAGSPMHIPVARTVELEHLIARIEEAIPAPHSFVIPGATQRSAWFDYARSVARRAERALVRARSIRFCDDATMRYVNRLSSALYALARYAATCERASERAPVY